jgi:hypothetical protein
MTASVDKNKRRLSSCGEWARDMIGCKPAGLGDNVKIWERGGRPNRSKHRQARYREMGVHLNDRRAGKIGRKART